MKTLILSLSLVLAASQAHAQSACLHPSLLHLASGDVILACADTNPTLDRVVELGLIPMIGAAGADVYTTGIVIGAQRGHEVGGLSWLSGHPVAFGVVAMSAHAGIAYAIWKLHVQHPWWALAAEVAEGSYSTYLAVHNAHVAGQ